MQKIITHLWYNNQAEEAANFYTSLFKNSRIISVARYPEGVPGQTAGSVMTVEFELDGQRFFALNGGPEFKFNESISLYVNCDSQEEVDRLWNAFTANGGEESQCGWLKDRFGVSWQIVPTRLIDLMNDPDPVKAQRVTQAMLQMKKIDIPVLEHAYAHV